MEGRNSGRFGNAGLPKKDVLNMTHKSNVVKREVLMAKQLNEQELALLLKKSESDDRLIDSLLRHIAVLENALKFNQGWVQELREEVKLLRGY